MTTRHKFKVGDLIKLVRQSNDYLFVVLKVDHGGYVDICVVSHPNDGLPRLYYDGQSTQDFELVAR